MLTLEEKKTQNNAILDNAKEATEAEKKAKKRAGSVSVQNNGAFSLQTLLPQLKVAVDNSTARLT
jgi:hypothetical protein